MTKPQSTEFRFLDRAPIVGDLITVTPYPTLAFEVDALDDLYQELIYAHPAGSERAPRWYFLTHVRVIDDEPIDLDCDCGHPDCGAC